MNAEFEWSSSNDEILRVWHNRFRGLKEGTAYVIARSDDGVIKYYINEKGFLSVYLYDPENNLFFKNLEDAKDECFRRNRIYVTVLEREAEDSKII